jgi:hypothetical protein
MPARSAGGSQGSRTSSIPTSSSLLDSSDDEPLVLQARNKDQAFNDAERHWPSKIRVVYNDGTVKIRQQNHVIKTIIAEAIHRCEHHMITVDAFPETGQREEFRLEMAKKAIKSLRARGKDNEDYKEAWHRAKKDGNFIHRIGEVVSGH